MTGKRRTQAERSGTTRAALLGAAHALFAERGYAEVGTEDIVRAAGLTRGALYHHFRDKSELFAAVFEALEAEVAGRIAAAAAAGGTDDPVAILRLGASTWLEACAEPGVLRIVLLDAPAVLGWERWVEIGDRHNFGLVQGLLAHAMELGRIAPQPVPPLAHALLGSLRETALYLARADDPVRARAEVAAVLDTLIRSLAIG